MLSQIRNRLDGVEYFVRSLDDFEPSCALPSNLYLTWNVSPTGYYQAMPNRATWWL